MQNFALCQQLIKHSSIGETIGESEVKKSVVIDGDEHEYLSPDELYKSQTGFEQSDVLKALEVIKKFGEEAAQQENKIEQDIHKLEAIVSKPYSQHK